MAAPKPSPVETYGAATGRVYLSGNQALVRMTVEQARRDRALGWKTGGFVSGYRGSPLGHLDQDFTRVRSLLDDLDIRFQAGVNEDMAATAVWGTQQIGFFNPKFEGVFGLWYSKGPGVDRSGDALRHANLWGTAPKGGVVMAVGDDPMSRSSSIQQQSEHTLASMCIPTFNAANVQDIHDFGLIGWQLSRYAGVWTAVKAVSDIYESWLAIDVDPARTRIELPPPPAASVHTRWPDRSVDQDERMLKQRLPAVLAFARLNRLNYASHTPTRRRVGIISTGKSWSDTVEALTDLGIDDTQLEAAGIAIFKVGLVWPLEPSGIVEFARGLSDVLVIEECRPILEPQIKDILFNLPAEQRPRVLGKRNLQGETWLPSHGELTPALISRVLYQWLEPVHRTGHMQAMIAYLDEVSKELARPRSNVIRTPHFCSGCPHNSSTKVPAGSKQLAGIGCHWLANLMDRDVVAYPHMGGEGANWAGAAHFLKDEHIFVNVGDGTWYHSGSMAIRQAVAANVNITYKLLYNDAVAMTGGQAVDGPISVAQITHELRGESVATIAVVSVRPEQYRIDDFAPGTSLHHRDELESLQRRFREAKGVSVIIYEQTCATELRRRRGKKLVADPARRVLINDRVCEGCGDCSVQSNCLSVLPLETEFGRKRTIDQSACNKDFSCIKGFCPSFVTVEGGELARPAAALIDDELFRDLPRPSVQATNKPFGVMVTGIGGTGVVTISNLIGAAAQAEGKVVQALDLTGLAQKFGAVYCHLKVAEQANQLHATRLSTGQCDVLIGADIVTAASDDSLSRLRKNATWAVVNDHATVTGAFTRDRDFTVPIDAQRSAIEHFCGQGRVSFVDATQLAERLTGNTIGANIMLLGFACQMGWLPVTFQALDRAIEANGVNVKGNLLVFKLGRLLAQDPEKVRRLANENAPQQDSLVLSETLDQLVERRMRDLSAFQNDAVASWYRERVDLIRGREVQISAGTLPLTNAVARNLFKLIAYKDEYEVARLFTDGAFLKGVRQTFAGRYRLRFHMAPPIFARTDPNTGRPKKREFGPWMMIAMRWLAKGKVLRGTAFDPFGRSPERRAERALVREYERVIADIAAQLTKDNAPAALALARWPEAIRGYGPVKEQSIAKARASLPALVDAFHHAEVMAAVA